MWKTWSCPFAVFLHLFCFLDLLFFCFYFAFILLSAWKKAKQMQNKSKQNSKSKKQNNWKNANGQVHFFFPCYSPFWRSFFSHLFCFRFFWVLKLCFLIFHVFSFFFFWHFFKLKIIRKSYGGEHKASHEYRRINLHTCWIFFQLNKLIYPHLEPMISILHTKVHIPDWSAHGFG